MAIALSVLVTLTIASEFYRGAKVIGGHTGQGMFASMVQLTHRNTRRYGGYIVHFGVVVVIIGFAGYAFNQDKEQEMGYGDKMKPWSLHARLPLLYPGRQSQLRRRMGRHRCLQRRSEDRHHDPGAPVL